MTLTPTQSLACQAEQISRCLNCDPNLQMGAIIALLSQLAESTMDCPALAAAAAQFSCIPRQLQVPAMIYQLNAILTGNGIGGLVYSEDWGGNPPPFIPPSLGAIGIDSVTGRQWQFSGGSWS